MKNSRHLVLASASPRRIELLKEIGLDFKVDPADFEEKDTHLTPKDLVEHNSLGKAQVTAHKHKNSLVIGVDTVGVVGDTILNKPKNHAEAKKMLKLLSGSKHRVISAITIIDTDTKKALTEIETTYVYMDELTEEEMEEYLASGEGDDKAAGYAIQGKGALYIKKIEGDYFNVVGLPIFKLRRMLKTMNYKINL
ncbi:septum formation protein Maf [Candidatus Peregrinibacteria bacterium]|nr:septum formation protein Maf [Candidatus Peregrinibacteria bacterium]